MDVGVWKFASVGHFLHLWAIFSRPCFEKHSRALQFSICCKLSKLTINRKEEENNAVSLENYANRHRTYTVTFYFLLLVLESSKNMLMKDTTQSRLTGVGIYSLHTFYAKIINRQWNKRTMMVLYCSPEYICNLYGLSRAGY